MVCLVSWSKLKIKYFPINQIIIKSIHTFITLVKERQKAILALVTFQIHISLGRVKNYFLVKLVKFIFDYLGRIFIFALCATNDQRTWTTGIHVLLTRSFFVHFLLYPLVTTEPHCVNWIQLYFVSVCFIEKLCHLSFYSCRGDLYHI